MKRVRNNRGAVLIVVLGVLMVLALLATTFASLQFVERSVSRNYLDVVRATLLAQSGAEYAAAELQKEAERNLVPAFGVQPWQYWGDDLDEGGPGAGNVTLRLEESRNPSFAYEDEIPQDPYDSNVAPKTVIIEGAARGFSGVMSAGAYGRNADLYVLKVSDASGKIYLNEGVTHYRGNASTASRNLRRILNRLGALSTVQTPGLGDLVVDNRPAAGYRSVRELRKFLTDPQFLRVEDFVTAHAWIDPNVANPIPVTAARASAAEQEFPEFQAGGGPMFWRDAGTYRFGRGKNYLNEEFASVPALAQFVNLEVYPADASKATFAPSSLMHGVYAMDELNPQYIEITSRAPVNVNAAPREVLIALLSDLRGVFISERRRNNIETARVGGYHYMKVKHTYSPEVMPDPTKAGGELNLNWAAGATYYANVNEGDEIGFLYETYPILGPGGTGSGISSADVAEHFLACRERRATQGVVPAVDYSDAAASPLPFRGPFRTWRQFNAFCDHLVDPDQNPATAGVLNDPRVVFYDHDPGPIAVGQITGNTPVSPSSLQRLAACQAIADVLKANFNPNLHLNEINPDKSLHVMVDKTDLVVNSTEFLFTPTGYYDIQSVGRVLDPDLGDDALVVNVNNRLVAEAKVQVGVRVFDLKRETNQSQFREDASPVAMLPVIAGAAVGTNNGCALEIGPEPDNGKGPEENEWSGYLAWSTIGGNLPVGSVKTPGAQPVPTPDDSSVTDRMDATIHTHLSWDFDAHYHADGIRGDMGSVDLGNGDFVENHSDPGETPMGPYDPIDGTEGGLPGNRYRLARGFRLPPASASGSLPLPALSKRAPLDLRVDGGYNERHSGLAYWVSALSSHDVAADMQGALSYWVKPNFSPARTGKPRLFMDMSKRIVSPCFPPRDGYGWTGFFTMAHFTNLWNAGYDQPSYASPSIYTEQQSTWSEMSGGFGFNFGPLPFKPQSMIFGNAYGWATGYSQYPAGTWSSNASQYYQFLTSKSLNHETHGHPAPVAPSLLKDHEWMHVALSWKKAVGIQAAISGSPGVGTYSSLGIYDPTTRYEIFINDVPMTSGDANSSSLEVLRNVNVAADRSGDLVNYPQNAWTIHANGDRNSLRFGSPSLISRPIASPLSATTFSNPINPIYDNFSADSTFDEIYFWKSKTYQSAARSHFSLGRFYFPRSASEERYTSRSLTLTNAGDTRALAPESGIAPPVVSGGGAGGGSGSVMSSPVSQSRILGIAWTWFAETPRVDAGGNWIWTPITDHKTGMTLVPAVEACIASDAAVPVALTPWMGDDGYSPLRTPTGQPLIFSPGGTYRYQLRFTLPGADPLNTVVLASPVVDDVTIYCSAGDALYTYYYHDAQAM